MVATTRDRTRALSGEAPTPKAAVTRFSSPVTARGYTDFSVWYGNAGAPYDRFWSEADQGRQGDGRTVERGAQISYRPCFLGGTMVDIIVPADDVDGYRCRARRVSAS